MRFATAGLTGLCAAALAACGPTAPEDNAGTVGNDVVTENDLLANSGTDAAAASGSLQAYVGKYPFDAVDGVSFLENPLVREGITRAGGEIAPVEMILNGPGPTTPIEMANGKVMSWGCEQHNCGAHNWTLLIAPDGSSPELCYNNEEAQPATRWLIDGAPVERVGDCQSVGENT